MIDIETQVFNKVSAPLRAQFTTPAIYIIGEPVKAPPTFPAVTMYEIDNSTYTSTMTNAIDENHANITYEFNIYSNKMSGKKTECKNISKAIDSIMQSLGFKRISHNQIPNLDDATIFRINSRYKAVVSKAEVIYKI